jgi:hypothetical protein
MCFNETTANACFTPILRHTKDTLNCFHQKHHSCSYQHYNVYIYITIYITLAESHTRRQTVVNMLFEKNDPVNICIVN